MDIHLIRETFVGHEWPQFIEMDEKQDTRVLSLGIDKSIRWFTGHFPQQPVLAGVVQTHWAGMLGRHLFEVAEDFVQLSNLKFHSVILPSQVVTLHLGYVQDINAIKFRYEREGTLVSEGKFRFTQDDPSLC